MGLIGKTQISSIVIHLWGVIKIKRMGAVKTGSIQTSLQVYSENQIQTMIKQLQKWHLVHQLIGPTKDLLPNPAIKVLPKWIHFRRDRHSYLHRSLTCLIILSMLPWRRKQSIWITWTRIRGSRIICIQIFWVLMDKVGKLRKAQRSKLTRIFRLSQKIGQHLMSRVRIRRTIQVIRPKTRNEIKWSHPWTYMNSQTSSRTWHQLNNSLLQRNLHYNLILSNSLELLRLETCLVMY